MYNRYTIIMAVIFSALIPFERALALPPCEDIARQMNQLRSLAEEYDKYTVHQREWNILDIELINSSKNDSGNFESNSNRLRIRPDTFSLSHEEVRSLTQLTYFAITEREDISILIHKFFPHCK